MAPSFQINPLEVKGVKYLVDVTKDGTFHTKIGDVDLVADSRDALVKKIQAATKIRAAKVKIPFSMIVHRTNEPDKVRHGVITGVHHGTRSYLIRWADGQTEQIPPHRMEYVLQPLSEAETNDLQALMDERRRLSGEIEKFNAAHRAAGLRVQVQQALEAVMLSKEEKKA